MAMLVAFLSLSSAYAFTPIPLTLPTQGLTPTIPGGRGRQVIVVVPFEDQRGITRCGMQKNGYNMDTADAVCQSDPNVWLAQLLADELRASGFTVLEQTAEHRPGARRIEGSLTKLFVEPVIGFWAGSLEADLSVTLRVSTQTGLEASRKFFVKGRKGGGMASTTQPFHTSLHRATQALLRGDDAQHLRADEIAIRSSVAGAIPRWSGSCISRGSARDAAHPGAALPGAAPTGRLRPPRRGRARGRPDRQCAEPQLVQRSAMDRRARAVRNRGGGTRRALGAGPVRGAAVAVLRSRRRRRYSSIASATHR